MKRKVAIITGVSSFLGRNVARKLLANGFIVFGIVRSNSKRLSGLNEIKGLKLVTLDFDKIKLSDFDNVNVPDMMDCDITFIHFAWGATLDRSNFMAQMYNVDYSMKVLQFARLLKVKRFIFAGSQAEMSDSAYGMAKKEFADRANKILINEGIDFIHLRIFSVYGKEDRETTILKTLVKLTKEGKDVGLSTCEYMWNFLYIDDFTDIINLLIEKKAKRGTYDIASDDTRLLKDYVIEGHKLLKGKNYLNFGERPDSTEKFAIPNISLLLDTIGKYDFTKFSKGILKI